MLVPGASVSPGCAPYLARLGLLASVVLGTFPMSLAFPHPYPCPQPLSPPYVCQNRFLWLITKKPLLKQRKRDMGVCEHERAGVRVSRCECVCVSVGEYVGV